MNSETHILTPRSPNEPVEGHIFIISAPSGAGKTTLCKIVRQHFGDLAYSVSYTTRAPRAGEVDGQDYFFLSTEAFQNGITNGQWAEWALVHGHYYGTAAAWISDTLNAGRDILMDIDIQGARQILSRFVMAVTIFIMPPSMAVLEQRISKRGTDDQATIALRLANAQREMDQKEFYRHVVVNDRLDEASRQLIQLIGSYRHRTAAAETTGV